MAEAIFKYNSGAGALICSECRTILKEGDEMTIGANHQFMDFQEMGRAFTDDRPLTAEILEELGFVRQRSGEWQLENVINDRGLFADMTKGEYYVAFDFPMDATKPVPTWTTVGSVRMLIEALKGDE